MATITQSEDGPDDEVALRDALLMDVGEAFSPAAPISRRELFAGRLPEIGVLMEVVAQVGQHAVIYGERGVGKTSMAATMASFLRGRRLGIRVNCDGTDTFGRVWHKVFEEVALTFETRGPGFTAESQEGSYSAAAQLPAPEQVTPNDVRRVLGTLADVQPVIFIDEFDRLVDIPSTTLFADTIKTLSDHLVRATVVIVGVADTVDELIAEHQSVERALVQILMPRMSVDELSEIVRRMRREPLNIAIDEEVVSRIARLSRGLPHYTHLLAQEAARHAVLITDDLRDLAVSLEDIERAVELSLQKARESVTSIYQRATFSPRTTLYREVLLACALLHGDDFGYFTAGDVRKPLSSIMGRRYEIPAFAAHLKDLSSTKRGPVLQRSGETRRQRYRFLNPLLQPYVVMRGLADGLVSDETLREFTVG